MTLQPNRILAGGAERVLFNSVQPASFANTLERKFRAKLQLPRCRGRAGDQARGWVWYPIATSVHPGIQHGVGKTEIGVIQNVKNIQPQLQIRAFGDARIFRNAHIHVANT